MKKIVGTLVSVLGILSAIVALLDIYPEYNNIYWVLAGILIGFFLGVFVPEEKEKRNSTPKERALLLLVVLFLLPPFILAGLISLISGLGFMTPGIIQGMLIWGFWGIITAYIVAGCVTYYMFSPSANSEKNNQEKENP